MRAHRRGVSQLEALVLVRGSLLTGSPAAAPSSSPGAGRNRVAPEPPGSWEMCQKGDQRASQGPQRTCRPRPAGGSGWEGARGQGPSKGSSCPPRIRMPPLVCCSLTLKLNHSPTTFNTPPDSRKPKDFSLEWEPETFQISLRFQEIKLPLSPWMPSMARGHSQSPFSSVPD